MARVEPYAAAADPRPANKLAVDAPDEQEQQPPPQQQQQQQQQPQQQQQQMQSALSLWLRDLAFLIFDEEATYQEYRRRRTEHQDEARRRQQQQQQQQEQQQQVAGAEEEQRCSAFAGLASYYRQLYEAQVSRRWVLVDDEDETDDTEAAAVAAAARVDDGAANIAKCVDDCKTWLRFQLERLILWQDVRSSLMVLLAFNVVFWGIKVFQLPVMLAVCSTAVVMLLTLILFEEERNMQTLDLFQVKVTHFENLIAKLRSDFYVGLEKLERQYPLLYCVSFIAPVMIILAAAPIFDPFFAVYTVFMSFFTAPSVLLWCFGEQPSNKVQDGEIEEFLPEATEDNLQVLNRAGEIGERSPSPTNSDSNSISGSRIDQFDDFKDLENMKMPSHEEGSTDGLDLSDIELGPGDTDTDGLAPAQRRPRNLDHDVSSDSEDYNEDGQDLDVGESESSSGDDDFEIIDNRELEELKDV